jgi:hypothetical protein
MKAAERASQYKNRGAFKADELRRRREEQQVEIRRQKRDENLAKRRNLHTQDLQFADENPNENDEVLEDDSNLGSYALVR